MAIIKTDQNFPQVASPTIKRSFKGYYIFIVLIVVWKVVCNLEIWSTYILPPPEKVIKTFFNMIKDGSIFNNTYASMKRIIIGFGISIAIGIPAGIIFAMYEKVYKYFKPLFNFLRNIPPLALIPMLILWVGIEEEPKIIIIILASVFPIFMNTLKGIRNCDLKLIEVGKAFEFSKYEIITKIIIPNAVLDIAVGLRLALGYSFRAIIGAELIAASSGLGYLISDGKEMSRTDVVIVGIIVIGSLGMISDYIFLKFVEKAAKGKMVEAYD